MRRVLSLLALLFLAVSAMAHPYHTSTMELSLSQYGKRLQVALQMLPEDVEQLASEQEGLQLTLLNQQRVQHHMRAYLRKNLLWQQGEQALKPNDDLEMEWDSKHVWFYFTVPLQNQQPVALTSHLLFALHPDALNIVVQLLPGGRSANTLNLRSRYLEIPVSQLRKE